MSTGDVIAPCAMGQGQYNPDIAGAICVKAKVLQAPLVLALKKTCISGHCATVATASAKSTICRHIRIQYSQYNLSMCTIITALVVIT